MSHPPPPHKGLLSSSSSSSGSQACAACKYQRRKCSPDCPLAPHFPPNHHKEFYNAHKLFGVSNMLKIIRDLTPNHRSLAMKTIIHEANVRALDPVGGCYHMILRLQYQIKFLEAQLDLLLRQLAFYQSLSQFNDDPQNEGGEVMGLQSLMQFEQHGHLERGKDEEEEDVMLVHSVEKSCSEPDACMVFDNMSVKIEMDNVSPGQGKASSQLLKQEDNSYVEMKPSSILGDFEQNERNHIPVGLH